MTKGRMVDFIVASGLVGDLSAVELMKESKSYIQGLFFGAMMYQSKVKSN